LAYKKACQGACSEEKLLLGQYEMLDAYVKELKKHVYGRGVYRIFHNPNPIQITVHWVG